MEKFDTEKAARVWQRVQTREEPMPQQPDHGVLIRSAGEQAGRYRQLSRMMAGNGEKMGAFRRQQLAAADCLKGICRLSGIPVSPGANPSVPPEPLARLMEITCHGERQLVGEYSARMADPEWGRVYAHLASEAAQRCAVLLEMIGGLQRQPSGHPGV